MTNLFTPEQLNNPNFLLEQMDSYDKAWANKTEFPFSAQVRDQIEIQYDELTMTEEEREDIFPTK